MRRPLIIILPAYGLGVLSAQFFAVPLWLISCWLLGVLGITGWAIYNRLSMAPVFVVLTLLLMGVLRMAAVTTLPPNFITCFVQNTAVRVEGVIVEGPDKKADGEKDWLITYVLKAEQILLSQSSAQPAQGKIRLTVRQPRERRIYQLGDKIFTKGELKLPKPGSNPGQPDFRAYYLRKDIGTTMSVTGDDVAKTGTAAIYLPLRLVQKLRDNLALSMTIGMGDCEAALLKGLVFGERTNIPAEVEWAFADTGLVHILSVSGYHIALIAALVCALLRLSPWSQDTCTKATMVCIGAYVLLVGFSAPVLRAAVMAVILLGAMVLRRKKDALHALLAAGWLMLLWDPRQLYDLGFQLSFGATAGLILLSPKLIKGITFLPAWINIIFGTTAAATLAVLPILAHHFQQISVISLVANLWLTIPVSVLIMCGLLAAVLGGLWAPLAATLSIFNNWLTGWIIQSTDILAAVPYAYFFVPAMSWWQVGCYYLLLIWVFSDKAVYGLPRFEDVWENRRQRGILFMAICCTLWLGAWYEYTHREVTVTFLDVGQGDSAVIRTPNGCGILIDGGGGMRDGRGYDSGTKVIIPYLRYTGIRQLDWIILSHGHEDHAGGLRTVLQHISANGLLAPSERKKALPYQELLELCTQKNIPVLQAERGQRFIIDGVGIEVISAADNNQKEENEASLVVKITYGGCSILFTGDLDGSGEQLLAQSGQDLQSTILKVGHHGSPNGTSASFLARVNPAVAVISVGHNAFGHPAASVLERLREQGIQVYRTDQDGAVVMRTNGQGYRVRTVLLEED